MNQLLTLLTALSLAQLVPLEEVPTDEVPKWNVQIEMQVVAVPDRSALTLVPELRDPTKSEAAYAKIQELLARGEATLIGWPIVTTCDRQRAVMEAVNEITYATEFDPPTVNFWPNRDQQSPPKILPNVDVTHFDGIPRSFATRNAGVTLEIEPVISGDAKTIQLNLIAEHVRLRAFNKITIEKPATGGKVVVEQPEFIKAGVTTTLTVRQRPAGLAGSIQERRSAQAPRTFHPQGRGEGRGMTRLTAAQ